MPAGYSGTPLARKLGIKPGHRIAVINEPDDFRSLLDDLPPDAVFQDGLEPGPDLVIAFYTEREALEAGLDVLGQAVFPDKVIWYAWPKKASKVPTDLSGDVVRAAVLSTKLVDVKVCAISDTWSGLKVVWRKEHRR